MSGELGLRAGVRREQEGSDLSAMVQSFTAAVVELIPKLRTRALKLVRSPADADDLVQDALVRAWRFQNSYESGTNLAGWLLRILQNEHFNQMAKKQPPPSAEDLRLALAANSEASQEWSYRYGEVLAALPKLTNESRDALLKVVGSGMTYAEAGRSCGCDANTMKQRVYRARNKLAELTAYEADARRGLPTAPPLRRHRA